MENTLDVICPKSGQTLFFYPRIPDIYPFVMQFYQNLYQCGKKKKLKYARKLTKKKIFKKYTRYNIYI